MQTGRVSEQSRKTSTEAHYGVSGWRWEDCTTTLYLQDDTFIALLAVPNSLVTEQVTVRFAVGTTVILCVIFPLMKGLSSS